MPIMGGVSAALGIAIGLGVTCLVHAFLKFTDPSQPERWNK